MPPELGEAEGVHLLARAALIHWTQEAGNVGQNLEFEREPRIGFRAGNPVNSIEFRRFLLQISARRLQNVSENTSPFGTPCCHYGGV